jgi:hypothetical protein
MRNQKIFVFLCFIFFSCYLVYDYYQGHNLFQITNVVKSSQQKIDSLTEELNKEFNENFDLNKKNNQLIMEMSYLKKKLKEKEVAPKVEVKRKVTKIKKKIIKMKKIQNQEVIKGYVEDIKNIPLSIDKSKYYDLGENIPEVFPRIQFKQLGVQKNRRRKYDSNFNFHA